MERKIVYGLGLLFIPLGIYGQQGCMDPLANNFDPGATLNDGSCTYDLTSYVPEEVVALPSPELNENSALIYFNDHLWTINDGGNAALLYELDTLGNLIREIQVTNAQNVDWEAISQNSSSILIGDFGNNSGSRENLCIYTIDKGEVANPMLTEITAQKNYFRYEDQADFSWGTNAHNFDCEAFIAYDDSMYLFSKNWLDEYTKLYSLPVSWPDTIVATLEDSFFVNGLITDASINQSSGNVFLLGYKNNGGNLYSSFVWMLWDYNQREFFTGNKRRIEIGSMFTVGQTEGLCLQNESRGFMSSEQISSVITIDPKLFKFDFSQFLSDEPLSTAFSISNSELYLYPNPVNDEIKIDGLQGEYRIYSALSNKLVQQGLVNGKKIDVSGLNSGAYLLHCNTDTLKFIKE